MMTCLIILINASFKIIAVQGMMFTASSVLCPVVACLYLIALSEYTIEQQRRILNQSLLALYLFSIGVYLLVNLPSADYVRDNMAYQIVFEDIPKKFFAATLAFGLGFYLPHLLCSARQSDIFVTPRKYLLLALFGGFSFFTLDFLLLFSDPPVASFTRIYIDSFMVATGIMLTIGIGYLACLLFGKRGQKNNTRVLPDYLLSPVYQYLLGFSVIIILICLACEYRLISFSNGRSLAASGIIFPLVIMASNLIGELYGYKANLWLMAVLMISELLFDILLMITIMLPSPDFFDLNPFYLFIMPRRIPASTLALLVTFGSNALLLDKLKTKGKMGKNRGLRLFVANVVAISLLCLVNYSILFAGIYPYEQIFNLAINGWIYKFIFLMAGLPGVLWLYKILNVQCPVVKPCLRVTY